MLTRTPALPEIKWRADDDHPAPPRPVVSMPVQPRYRRARRSWLTGLVSVAAIALPAAIFWSARAEDSSLSDAQIEMAMPPIAPKDAAAYRAFAIGSGAYAASNAAREPLVLAYHDIGSVSSEHQHDDGYTVTPEAFAAQIAMLKTAGFRTLRASELEDWLAGRRALPPRRVVITFDDGTTGVWRYADPVLKQAGFRGMAFIITGRIGTHAPYYLTWDKLEQLRQSGRWDFESHTHYGHRTIRIDEAGNRGPFLINRAWLPREGRAETTEEFLGRLAGDLAASRRALIAHGLGDPHFFAFPFSAEREPTNDATSLPEVERILDGMFAASFSNDDPDRLASERSRTAGRLSRVEVFTSTTARQLFNRIVSALPTAGPHVEPLRDDAGWVDWSGHPLIKSTTSSQTSRFGRWTRFGDGTLGVAPSPGRSVNLRYAPGRSEDWSTYRAAVRIDGLGTIDGGPTATLSALNGSDAHVDVGISSGYVRVTIGGQVVTQWELQNFDAHDAAIVLGAERIDVVVDGGVVYSGARDLAQSGGVELGVSGTVGGGPTPVFSAFVVDDLALRRSA